MHIDNAETELRSERMAIARLKLDTERAELEARKAEMGARKAVAAANLASPGQRLHNLSRTTPTPPTSPKSSPVGSRRAPRPLRVRSTSPTAETTTILQMFERSDEQRREDQRREEYCEDRRAAAKREARLEARLATRNREHHFSPAP